MKKIVSLVLCCVCMFGMTGCFSELLSFGSMEPDKVVPKMKTYLDNSDLKEDNVFYEFTYDEGFQNYVLTLWNPDFNELAVSSVRLIYKNQNVEGASAVIEGWETLTEGITGISETVETKIKTYDDDAYLVVNFVNADDHEDILISVSDGVIVENIMDIY